MPVFKNPKSELVIDGAIWLMILYISKWVLEGFFGEQKICYIYWVISGNYCGGQYLLGPPILK